jgi:hypothetical protein
MALATLAGCALIMLSSFMGGEPSPITLAWMHPGNSAESSSLPWLSYVVLAGSLSVTNFIVQALHHHEQIGKFPDLALLFGPAASPVALSANKRQASRQVFSSWASSVEAQ